jgi:hypothetical protein
MKLGLKHTASECGPMVDFCEHFHESSDSIIKGNATLGLLIYWSIDLKTFKLF